MATKSLARKTYEECYRAIRLTNSRFRENDKANLAAERLIVDLISEKYGMMSLYAYTSKVEAHSGIRVNWVLRSRLHTATILKRRKAKPVIGISFASERP